MNSGGLPRRSHAPLPLVALVIVVSTVIALEIGARIVMYGLVHMARDSRAAADGYAGASWTEAYYRELRESGDLEWQPFVYWRRQ